MFNERVLDIDRRDDPHLSVEPLPRNASRVTVASILAQFGTGYAFQSLCVVPKEMVTLPDARPTHQHGRYFRWLALLNVYGMGALTGALFLLFLSNRFGRKITMGIGLLLALVGGVVQASSFGCIQFTIGRALAGGACGIVTAAAPVWQVEASSNTARGRVVISQIVASSCGAAIVSSALLSPSRNWENPDASFWRVVVALQCLPVVMSFLTLLISPESQRWHAHNSKGYRCNRPRASTFRFSYTCGSQRQQRTEVQELRRDMDQRGSYRLLISTSLIFLYSFSAFAQIRQNMSRAFWFFPVTSVQFGAFFACTIIWQALSCAISIAFIDKVGRRGVLLITFVGQAVSLIPLAVLASETYQKRYAAFIALEVFGFIAFGFVGFGAGMIWLCVAEINSQRFRLTGTAIGAAIAYGTYFGMVFLNYYVGSLRGWPTIFIVTNIIGASITYWLFPETTGRSLDDIDRYFEPKKSPIVTKDITLVPNGEWAHDVELADEQISAPRSSSVYSREV